MALDSVTQQLPLLQSKTVISSNHSNSQAATLVFWAGKGVSLLFKESYLGVDDDRPALILLCSLGIVVQQAQVLALVSPLQPMGAVCRALHWYTS